MNCCKKSTDMSSKGESGNIRKLHREQQTQRNKELQIATEQFELQPQTPKKKESNPYIRRNIAVEHEVSRTKNSQSSDRSKRSAELTKVQGYGENVNSNKTVQPEYTRQFDTKFPAYSNSGIYNSVKNYKLPNIHGQKKHSPEYDKQMQRYDNYNSPIRPKRQPPQGLPNIGNTCYANALLQVLGQTPDLYENIEEACKRKSFTTTKRVTSSFLSILQHMCTPTSGNIQISVINFMINISTRCI